MDDAPPCDICHLLSLPLPLSLSSSIQTVFSPVLPFTCSSLISLIAVSFHLISLIAHSSLISLIAASFHSLQLHFPHCRLVTLIVTSFHFQSLLTPIMASLQPHFLCRSCTNANDSCAEFTPQDFQAGLKSEIDCTLTAVLITEGLI
jgi:hypothetical protein